MKVGILTIYGGSNFGNKLQNYAMQQFLKSKKIESETIRYTVSWEKNKLGKREKLSLLKKKYFSQGVAESIWNVKWIVSAKFHKSKLAFTYCKSTPSAFQSSGFSTTIFKAVALPVVSNL